MLSWGSYFRTAQPRPGSSIPATSRQKVWRLGALLARMGPPGPEVRLSGRLDIRQVGSDFGGSGQKSSGSIWEQLAPEAQSGNDTSYRLDLPNLLGSGGAVVDYWLVLILDESRRKQEIDLSRLSHSEPLRATEFAVCFGFSVFSA